MNCDLCGNPAECVQKEIDGKVFDLCASCWTPIAEKLRGKGRAAGPAQAIEEYDEISTY